MVSATRPGRLLLAAWVWWLACNWLAPALANAQVPNDDIAQRLPLTLGQPRESRTDGCTVQWSCVDEKLTGKQIDYHNDQWFSFRPPRAGRYYVNIGQQRCRDVRGVQLVALTAGEVCRPATYRILASASLGNQDDVFVAFDAPADRPEILLCLDGYLHDFCRFTLSVDTVARGLPVPVAAPPVGRVAGARVVLPWQVADSITVTPDARFAVYRRAPADARSRLVQEVTVRRNAAGELERRYAVIDTLPAAGRYEYQVVLAQVPAPVSVLLQSVLWNGEAATSAGTADVRAPLDTYPAGTELVVAVFDVATNRLLARQELIRRPQRAEQGVFDARPWRRQGVVAVRIVVTPQASKRGRQPGREVLVPL